jgi:hypothetical protein
VVRPSPSVPRGIAVAVVFDWALTAQLTTQAVAAATGHLGLAREPATIAGRLVAAALLLALGEGLRRGVAPLRLVQGTIACLVTVLGIASAAVLLLGHGDRSLVASTIIELTFAPYMLATLLDRRTAAWFSGGGHRAAPRTSGPRWLLMLAAQGVVWGVVVAWSQSL